MNKFATQGRLILNELRKRPLTYMGMLKLGVSTSPWKRAEEALDPSREEIIRVKRPVGGRDLVHWFCVPKVKT